jgi:hypothetical protein
MKADLAGKRLSEARGRGSLRGNLNLRLITHADANVAPEGATPELMWCRYRGSRCDAFADNASPVFFARPVLIVDERVIESASSRRISGSKAKRHYQMDPYTWITRHETALRAIFDSEG